MIKLLLGRSLSLDLPLTFTIGTIRSAMGCRIHNCHYSDNHAHLTFVLNQGKGTKEFGAFCGTQLDSNLEFHNSLCWSEDVISNTIQLLVFEAVSLGTNFRSFYYSKRR